MNTKSLAAVALVLFSACTSKDPSSQKASQPPPVAKVQGYVVVAKTLDDDFNVSGSLLANEQTDLHPELSGRVTGISFKEGSQVRKGDLLVKLYDADLQAQLKKLQVQLQIAQKNEQRLKELLAVNGASQQDYDAAVLQTSNVAADIEILKSTISKTEIRAPFDGRIGLRSISPGAYVTPASVVASIHQVGQLKLDFEVPERYENLMKTGTKVHFSVSGYTAEFVAQVIAAESNINEQSRTLKVRALVTSKDEHLLPGTFANVKVNLAERPAALMVPTQAIIPQSRNKRVIQIKDGVAAFVSVQTGMRSNSFVEITDGLKEHDTVLTTGLLSVKPGMKVDIGEFVH